MLDEELLQFADLVGFLVRLSEVEPASLALWSLLIVLLDDLLDLGDPRLLKVVGGLGYRRGLDLVEVIHSHRVVDVGVEDVTLRDVIALLADLLLGLDNLVFDLQSLEGVLRESLGE